MPQSLPDHVENCEIGILIVEDHEFTRIGLKMSLEQIAGLKMVGEAADGFEGLQKVLELKPEVVLMDIEMPVMDGIEATKLIKDQAPGVRVIMLTSHKSDQMIFAALSAGANGYCLKNISPQLLAMVIKMVAEGAVWLDPGIANRVLSAYSTAEPEPAVMTETAAKPAKTDVRLSPRETEVLRLVADGLSNNQVAEKLELGLETVKTHMRHIMEKLAVSDRTEAAVKALKQGMF